MTLIVGIRARDGIAIGIDRKILREFEVEYAPKYYLYNDAIVLMAVGLMGIVDDFYDLLQSEIVSRRGVSTLHEFKVIAEDILAELTKRYGERVGRTASVIVAGLDNIFTGRAKMYYIHEPGFGEHSRFICTGHGGPYALSLAKFLLDPEETVEENARRIAYIISWVGEDVDTTVGGEPDVFMIRDRENPEPAEPIIEKLEPDTIRQMMEKAREDKKNLPKILKFKE
ncbi:MAG: hypothetical protein GXO26_08790 [Crenarchaeota archaeon]|nr:hypothetical protein [Thermoproteota archaeon]